MSDVSVRTKYVLSLGASLLSLAVSCEAHAKRTEVVLYSFTGGADGANPRSTLTLDSAGNLYGTTDEGGPYSHGVVFKLAPNGGFSILYAFFGENDGGQPSGGVIFDAAGNLYGTASRGGVNNAGVIFKIAPDGRESTLHSFGRKQGDGQLPVGDFVADEQGNLYGAAEGGGTNQWGAIYMLTPAGKEKVLYSFAAGAVDGAPVAGLLRDNAGNLYGVSAGGNGSSGSVFKFVPKGTATVLYTFTGGDDGSGPQGSLVADKAGALYGTTIAAGANDRGVIFEIAPDGTETTVHSFNGSDGDFPDAGLITDNEGNFYGTTCWGGRFDNGVAFKLTAHRNMHVLHSFGVKGHGGSGCPSAKLTMDSQGDLFGTTMGGGADGAGSIFEIKR